MEKIKYLCKALHTPSQRAALVWNKRKRVAKEGDAGTEKSLIFPEEGLVLEEDVEQGRGENAVRV